MPRPSGAVHARRSTVGDSSRSSRSSSFSVERRCHSRAPGGSTTTSGGRSTAVRTLASTEPSGDRCERRAEAFADERVAGPDLVVLVAQGQHAADRAERAPARDPERLVVAPADEGDVLARRGQLRHLAALEVDDADDARDQPAVAREALDERDPAAVGRRRDRGGLPRGSVDGADRVRLERDQRDLGVVPGVLGGIVGNQCGDPARTGRCDLPHVHTRQLDRPGRAVARNAEEPAPGLLRPRAPTGRRPPRSASRPPSRRRRRPGRPRARAARRRPPSTRATRPCPGSRRRDESRPPRRPAGTARSGRGGRLSEAKAIRLPSGDQRRQPVGARCSVTATGSPPGTGPSQMLLSGTQPRPREPRRHDEADACPVRRERHLPRLAQRKQQLGDRAASHAANSMWPTHDERLWRAELQVPGTGNCAWRDKLPVPGTGGFAPLLPSKDGGASSRRALWAKPGCQARGSS